jgi:hypothetical protein
MKMSTNIQQLFHCDKFRILVIAMAGLGLAYTTFAADYKNLAGEGYRWVTVDGPYACSTEQVLKRITTHHTDATELEMVEEGGAYYLIPGAIVQVTKESPTTGMSEIHLAGIAKPLWTYKKFLSPHPIRDMYGVAETPENSGLIPSTDTGVIRLPSEEATPMPTPSLDTGLGKQQDGKVIERTQSRTVSDAARMISGKCGFEISKQK